MAITCAARLSPLIVTIRTSLVAGLVAGAILCSSRAEAQNGKSKPSRDSIGGTVTAQTCNPQIGCGPGSPPTVWFRHPISGTQHYSYPPAVRTDTADWCDDNGLSGASRSVTQNGTSLSTGYTTSTYSGCWAHAYSSFSFTPVLGTNTIYGSINDNYGQNGSAQYTFTYDSTQVNVTPKNGAKAHPMLIALADTFTVKNYSSSGVTYTLALTCTNAASLNCSGPSSVAVGSGGATSPVIVSYTTRGYNSVDTISLRATSPDGHQTDVGSIIETASQYSVTVSFAANNQDNQKLGFCANDCFTTVASHSTASYRSLGINRTVTLLYHGDRTAVRPYVLADVSVPSGASAPTEVRLKATVNGALQTFVNGDTLLHFSTTAWQGGKTYRVAGQLDLSSLATNMYPLVLSATAIYSDHTETFTNPSSMKMMVVNFRSRATILPTSGWTVAGIQQLYLQSDSTVLIVEGDGSGVYFNCNVFSGLSCPPAGDYSKLSASGGYYWRAYPDSSKVEFDGQGHMVEAVDRWGGVSFISYASSGPTYISSIGDPIVAHFQFLYDTTGRVITVELPSRGGGAPDNARQTTVRYDGGGHITSFTDADGISSRVAYDGQGRLDTLFDRLGDTTTYYYDASSWKLDSIALPAVPIDGQGQPQRPTTRLRSWQRVGVPTTSTYSTFATAPMLDTIYALAVGAIQDTTRFTADRWGQPLVSIDPLGNTTTVVRTGIFATSVTNPLGQTDTYVYTNGFLTSSTPYNQPTTYISYDAWGMPSQVSGGNAPTTTRTFNATARTITTTVDGSYVSTDSLDFRGRVYFSQDAAGHVSRTHFDAIFGNPDSTLAAAGQWTKAVQDGYGRDSALTALGHPAVQRHIYDVLGRDSLVYDGVNSQPIKYSYNGLYLTTVRDAKGQVYKSDINALGWPTVAYDPADTVNWTRKMSYKYDLAGRVTNWQNRRGSWITQQWDKLGRLTSQRDTTGTADSLSYSANGQIVVASNAVSVDTVTLGDRNANTVVTRIAGQWFKRVHSATDGVISDTTFVTSSLGALQNRIRFWSQSRGVLDSLAVGASKYQLGYTNELLPDTLRYPIGYRVDSLTTTHQIYARHYTASALDTAFGRGYAYDSLGRVRSESELSHSPGSTVLRSYGYNGTDALQWYKGTLIAPGFSCSGGYGCGYTGSTVTNTWASYGYGYDPVNNLTSQVDSLNGNALTSGSFAAGNRDTLWGTTRYTYDLDGNRASAGATTYSWSATGKLLNITNGSETISYKYNALGELVRKDTNNLIARYFIWDQGELLLLLNGSANRIAEYAYLPNGEPLSYTRGALSADTTYYFTNDLRGNVLGITDGNFQKQEINYAPWGDAENVNGSFDRDSTRLGWKGHMWEGGISQLYYVHNRWYDPASRGFISEDPIGLAGGLNTYAYGGNDAVNHSDPAGLTMEALNQMCPRGSSIDPDTYWSDSDGNERGNCVPNDGGSWGNVPGLDDWLQANGLQQPMPGQCNNFDPSQCKAVWSAINRAVASTEGVCHTYGLTAKFQMNSQHLRYLFPTAELEAAYPDLATARGWHAPYASGTPADKIFVYLLDPAFVSASATYITLLHEEAHLAGISDDHSAEFVGLDCWNFGGPK